MKTLGFQTFLYTPGQSPEEFFRLMNIFTYNEIEIPKDNWKFPEKKGITQSDIIKKYIEGLSDGYWRAMNTMENELKDFFKNNIKRAQKIGEEVFRRLKETGLEVDIAYMKIEPLEKFTILYQINASLFYSDKIIEGYKIFSEFQKENLNNDFYIVLFINFRESLKLLLSQCLERNQVNSPFAFQSLINSCHLSYECFA